MKINFNNRYGWNRGRNNELSYVTGLPTDDLSEQFTEKQIRQVLQTLNDLPEDSRQVIENGKKEAAKGSVLIEVQRGVHDVRDPHLMIDFLGVPIHVSLERDAEGNWKVKNLPDLKKLEPGNEISMEECLAVLEEYRSIHDEELFNNPDVTMVSTGFAVARKRTLKELAVDVNVYSKMSADKCDPETLIAGRDTFYSARRDDHYLVRIDIQEGGLAEPEGCDNCPPEPLRTRVEPITSGVAISNGARGTYGTLGGFFVHKGTVNVALSNTHVMEDPAIVPNNTLIQPGLLNHGVSPKDDFAQRLMIAKNLDAAIATANSTTTKRPFLYQMACTGAKVRKIDTPVLNMPLRKVGATTGCTLGVVTRINCRVKGYEPYGKNNILVKGTGGNFTLPGDSGAIYESTRQPGTFVGLHWGGFGPPNDRTSIGHPLPIVAEELSLSPMCSVLPAKLIDESLRQIAVNGDQTGLPTEAYFPVSEEMQPFFCGFYEILAREFEPLFSDENEKGQEVGYLLADSLMNCDSWRIGLKTLMEILKGKLTAAEVLHHTLTAADLENITRFLKVAGWVMGDERVVSELIGQVQQMEGRLFKDLAKIYLQPEPARQKLEEV